MLLMSTSILSARTILMLSHISIVLLVVATHCKTMKQKVLEILNENAPVL